MYTIVVGIEDESGSVQVLERTTGKVPNSPEDDAAAMVCADAKEYAEQWIANAARQKADRLLLAAPPVSPLPEPPAEAPKA